jgi:hypothetical protein
MTKNSKDTTRTITTLIAVGLMTVVPLRRAHAGHVTETIVAPVTITNQVGSYSGSINALATKDEIDTQNDSTKYVQFGTPPGSSYQGYFTYSLPPTVNPAQITTLTFLANVLGRPPARTRSPGAFTTGRRASMNRLEIRTFVAAQPALILATAVPTALSTPPTMRAGSGFNAWRWAAR